jgi:RNA-directed DNA polymerase
MTDNLAQATNGGSAGGRSLADLNEALEWNPEQLPSLAAWLEGTPSGYSYHSYLLPKRSGNGFRQIDAPNEDLKKLQRTIYKYLLHDEAIPTAATGFVVRRSIVDNAKPHVGKQVVINVDLKDFFPSIKEDRVQHYWEGAGWGHDAALVLTRICCYEKRLPQGAPTSPALSNVVNRFLDSSLDKLARKLGGQYSRYADDLTFSFEGEFGPKQRKLIPELRRILGRDGYTIQEKKLRIQRSHQRQSVTGLVVNEGLRLPRHLRRKIRALQHLRDSCRLDPAAEKQLRGYETFQDMVERQDDANPTTQKAKLLRAGLDGAGFERLKKILAKKAYTHPVDSKVYFRDLVRNAGAELALPENWSNEIGDPWVGDTNKDAITFLDWAISHGVIPGQRISLLKRLLLDVVYKGLGDDDRQALDEILRLRQQSIPDSAQERPHHDADPAAFGRL